MLQSVRLICVLRKRIELLYSVYPESLEKRSICMFKLSELEAKLLQNDEIENRSHLLSSLSQFRFILYHWLCSHTQIPRLVQNIIAKHLHPQPQAYQHPRLLGSYLLQTPKSSRKLESIYLHLGEIVRGRESIPRCRKYEELKYILGNS